MLFDVSFERHKTLMNEIGDFLIGVRLSFQPSACASSRRCREINQQRLVLSFCFGEGGFEVFIPIDEHVSTFLSLITSSTLNEQTKYSKGGSSIIAHARERSKDHALGRIVPEFRGV